MNIKNYINGEFLSPINENYIDNYNPSIGEVYGTIPNSTKEDVALAYKAASDAFPEWSDGFFERVSEILKWLMQLKVDEYISATFSNYEIYS